MEEIMKFKVLMVALLMSRMIVGMEAEFEEGPKDSVEEQQKDAEQKGRQEAQRAALEGSTSRGSVSVDRSGGERAEEVEDHEERDSKSGGLSFSEAFSANRSARAEFSMDRVSDVLEKQETYIATALRDLQMQMKMHGADPVKAERARKEMVDLYEAFWPDGYSDNMDSVMEGMEQLERNLDSYPVNPDASEIENIKIVAEKLGIDINNPDFKLKHSLIDPATGEAIAKAGDIDWQIVSRASLGRLRETFSDYNSVRANGNVKRIVKFKGEISALDPEYRNFIEKWQKFKNENGDMTSQEAQNLVDELSELGAKLSEISSQIDPFYDGVSGSHKYQSESAIRMKKYMKKSWFTSAKEWVQDFVNALRGKYPAIKVKTSAEQGASLGDGAFVSSASFEN